MFGQRPAEGLEIFLPVGQKARDDVLQVRIDPHGDSVG
jgi:hypothetical protein